jgi:hypothetical protein
VSYYCGENKNNFFKKKRTVRFFCSLRRQVCITDGPMAVVCKRKMCPKIAGLEGECHGHDAIAVDKAITYLTNKVQAKKKNSGLIAP